MKIKTLVLVENYDSPSIKEEYWLIGHQKLKQNINYS